MCRELGLAINRDKVEAAAIKLLQQGKYDKAIAELKKLVDDDKNDVRTLLKLGDTYVKIGNKKESIESYERAATIYTEQGFFLKAVAVYKQILRVDANIPELHLKLAELYQQLGLTSDALQHYQTVALAHEQAGRPRDALDMLKRMVDLDPDNIASRIKLGELFAQQGLAAEAVQELQNALSFLKTQQRYDDYVRVGEKLVAFDPNAVEVARELAQIYMQRQQPSVALGKLQLCFKADPRNVEVLAMIGQAFLDMQQVPKTVSVFKEMAKIYAADGKPDLANSMWERVLSLAPGDAEAEQALGRAPAARATAVPGAAAPLAVAHTAPPSRPSAEDEQLQRLLTETDVYVKYGLKEKAIEHLQKVFAVRADHIPALEKLKNLQQAVGGGELRETLRRLVAAAEAQGHPKVDEWRGELSRLAPPPRVPTGPAIVPPRSNHSGEGEIIVVDEPPMVADESFLQEDEPPLAPAAPASAYNPPPDEPAPYMFNENSASSVAIEDDSSGIMPLGPSQIDEPFISSEGNIESLPPDEEAPISTGEIPRMPTGVMSRGGVPTAQPLSTPAAPPVPVPTRPSVMMAGDDEMVGADADALVRQALREISAEDVVAAADLFNNAPPPPSDEPNAFDEQSVSNSDIIGDEYAATANVPQVSPSEASAVGFENHPSLRTGSSKSPLAAAVTTAQGPVHTSPTMSVPGAIDDEEIDRLAREAVADADRKLGGVIEANAMLGASAPELPPEMDASADGFDSFEERTIAMPALRSSDAPTDERPKRGAAAAKPPAMADASASISDDENVPTGMSPPSYASSLPQVSAPPVESPPPVPATGFGEVSDEFDPSSFDLPADVKELLRAQSSPPTTATEAPTKPAPAIAAKRAPEPAPAAEAPAIAKAQALGVADKAHGWEGDPANQFFPDELEEAEFFIRQELLDEAKEILTSILDDVPDSGRVQWMLARIEAKENGEPEPPAPWEQKLEEQILEEVQAHLDGLGFGDDPSQKPLGDATMQISVDEVLSQFKKGVAETVPEDDAATHYELGIAYREMGLHEDAIAEFTIAARAPSRAADARFLIGLVRKELGQFDQAVEAFEAALGMPTATKDQRGAAEYERGVALEELGRLPEALRALKAAKAHGSAAVDIDRRIKALIDKVGDVDAGHVNGNGSQNGAGGAAKTADKGAGASRGPKNIDYV
jgi:tetratricopeptide (TPR) repeat protein